MSLREKLHAVYASVDFIPKNGWNKFQNYAFIQSADVTHAIRKALTDQKVYAEINFDFAGGPYTIARDKSPNAPFSAVNVCCSIVFHDLEGDETITSSGLGTGADTGDKAAYKAMTGALKYALKNAFLIPDEADPEADGKTDEGAASEPDYHESRHSEPRANQPKQDRPTAAARSTNSHDVPLPTERPFAPPQASIPNAEHAAAPKQTKQASAPPAAPTREPGDESENDVPPTESELGAYRKQFKALGDALSEPPPTGGNLKSSKGLPINRKLLVFLLQISKVDGAKNITKSQWDNFFARVEAAKVAEGVGLVGLAKLINKANGLEEK